MDTNRKTRTHRKNPVRDRHAEDLFFLARVRRLEEDKARGPLLGWFARERTLWRRIAIARALSRLGVITALSAVLTFACPGAAARAQAEE